HELLCGQRLFVGENDLATLQKVRDMPIVPPSVRNPGVKPAFDRIVLRALARDPDKRYETARELGDELEGVTVRERYSTNAFSKKARELMPEAEAQPATAAAGTVGENVAKAVADLSAPHRSVPALAPVRPPAPPAAALSPAPRRAVGAATAAAPRWVWFA